MNAAELEGFVADLVTYSQVAAKWHDAVWLYSLRRLMCLDKETFDRLALAAHQADLIELSRADLVGEMDPRCVSESELETPSGARFHFVRFP